MWVCVCLYVCIYIYKYRLVSILIFNTTYSICHFTGASEEIRSSCIKPTGCIYPKIALEIDTFSSSVWNNFSQRTSPFPYNVWSLNPEIQIWVLLILGFLYGTIMRKKIAVWRCTMYVWICWLYKKHCSSVDDLLAQNDSFILLYIIMFAVQKSCCATS